MIFRIVLAFVFTAAGYLAFPIVYVNVKGKVPKKKATKMAIINSVVCAVIFSVAGMILFADDPSYTPNFLPAIFYYEIAWLILREINPPKELK